jgi:hypothetical protein
MIIPKGATAVLKKQLLILFFGVFFRVAMRHDVNGNRDCQDVRRPRRRVMGQLSV